MTFLHFNFTNVYRGLDNVALVVRPKPTLSAADPTLSTPPKALLVASHYDSAVCSHGGGCLHGWACLPGPRHGAWQAAEQ